jgi:outer membrane usher protein
VFQAGIADHKINARKYLNARLFIMALLTLTPPAVLAEEIGFAADEVFLEMIINQQPMGIVLLLRSDDRLFLGSKDLRGLRLRLPDITPLTLDGEEFYAFDTLEGLSYRFEETTQTLIVEAPPSLFDVTLLKGMDTNFSAPNLASQGGFLNYNLYANHRQGQTSTKGLMELGGFGGWGAAQTHILVKDLNEQAKAIRLDTTWTRDLPMQTASLRFGDAVSGTSSWGGAVRFGGIQWASNFSIQPGYIPFPLPDISGEVALPSTVNLYVNNALRMTRKVPIGPFSIEDLPVTTGQGDARLVVSDVLGHEKVINKPFFTSSRLLKPGLQDYSYELGFVRRNIGSESNNYGYPLAVGTHRLGLSEQFTREIHVELLSNQQSAGLSGVLLSPVFGELSGSFAVSQSEKGLGRLLQMGFNRQISNISFGAKTQLASQRFVKLGMLSEKLAPKQINQMYVQMTNSLGSFGASYAHQAFYDRNEKKVFRAAYSKKLRSNGSLSVSMNRSLSGTADTHLYLNFSMPLGKRGNVSISNSGKLGRGQTRLQVGSGLSEGNGVGYNLLLGIDNPDQRHAEVNMQNEVGNYKLAVKQSQGQTYFRGEASGSVAFLEGGAFLSSSINDSFALVQVADYPDVGIYADNKLVSRTNAKGYALISKLRPYEKNLLRIEQSDLPYDAQIDGVQLEAVPYFRSGLFLKFPVKRSRSALLSVVLENGNPLPAGAQAQIIEDSIGENEVFPVGLRGEVYLTGLAASNRLRINWKEQSCDFAFTFPETIEPLPHLGIYTCTGVKP